MITVSHDNAVEGWSCSSDEIQNGGCLRTSASARNNDPGRMCGHQSGLVFVPMSVHLVRVLYHNTRFHLATYYLDYRYVILKMVKSRTNVIYDSDDGTFDDAFVSHEKSRSHNKPRDQPWILLKDARKRTTGTNLESTTRGMSRVGQGGKFAPAESIPLTKRSFEDFPPPKPVQPLVKRDKPRDKNRNLKAKADEDWKRQDREDALNADRKAKKTERIVLNWTKAEARRESAHQQRSRAAKNQRSNDRDSDSENETSKIYKENPSLDFRADSEERRENDEYTPADHGRVYSGVADEVMSDEPESVYMQPPQPTVYTSPYVPAPQPTQIPATPSAAPIPVNFASIYTGVDVSLENYTVDQLHALAPYGAMLAKMSSAQITQ